MAWRELDEREIPGDEDNPRIVLYHSSTSLGATDDEVPWCSSYVNWIMAAADIPRTGSARARSWLYWGKALDWVPYGAVCILKRGGGNQPGPEILEAPGHVGFVVGDAGMDKVLILGGNQSNAVSVKSYPVSQVLGYRWPG